MSISPERYASLSAEEKCRLWARVLDLRWRKQARPEQIPFKQDTSKVAMFMAGRASGKTFSASNWITPKLLGTPNLNAFILAPTYSAGFQTCLFSPKSGICSALIKDESLWKWQEKKYLLTLANGSTVRIFSSEHPKDMRGPEFHLGWIDELADLKNGMECWQILNPAVRLPWAEPSRIYCTGTPRATDLMLYIMDRAEKTPQTYEFAHGRMIDNKDNLDPTTVDELYEMWQGTRYFLQEMEGVLLREAKDALWTHETISECRLKFDDTIKFETLVISVDPAVSTEKKADETGIIVGGLYDKKAYILADYSRKASPLEWARMLVKIAQKHGCGTIVYERNLAGPLIRDVLVKTLDEMDAAIRLVPISASQSKGVRAEPVAALYEAKKVFHMHDDRDSASNLNKLEQQLTQWSPSEAKSPDRLDALVHLVRHLLLRPGRYNIMRASDLPWNK